MKDSLDDIFKFIREQTNILAEAIKQDWKIPITIAVIGAMLTGVQIGLQYWQFKDEQELQKTQFKNEKTIQETQFKNELELQRERFLLSKKIGYLQILKDIYLVRDETKKKELFDLIFSMESIDSNTPITTVIGDKLELQKEEIKNLQIGILKNFEIVIFYPTYGDLATKLEDKATAIKAYLESKGLEKNKVSTQGFTEEWIKKKGGLSNKQIRYEKGIEDEAAKILKELLSKSELNLTFRLQTIRGTSENYLSIFLKDLN